MISVFKNDTKKQKKAMKELRLAAERASGLDVYISSLLRDVAREHPLNDPYQAFIRLRESFVPVRLNVVELKAGEVSDTTLAERFARLKEAIGGGLPPLSEGVARQCAIIADRYRGNSEEFPRRGADVAWHFSTSSSSMTTGRLLAATIRFMRPTRCIEIGTAYGLSASMIASALQRVSPQGRLLTIEIGDIQHRLSAALLAELFSDRIECCHGSTETVLSSAAARMAPIEFVFHDGGHSGDAYVRDFNTLLDGLASGAVVVFDDIRWQNRYRPNVDMRCYEGWRKVVDHPRVERAVEIDDRLGMVMVS